MRSTITLNGKNSNTIEGLLIQSLPPISKPLMRTTIEEIDGRDGDIVTNLGFSAYTKEFTIGLYGNYDINEVIAYFASEGTVIFSNEPDKYYNYQIIDQIDYERLIRFRTATVSMHCQPFKYSDTEGTEIYEDSSNLVTIPDFTRTTNGVTVSVSAGHMTVSGESTAATEFYVPITSLSLAAGSYTMSAVGSGSNPEACSLRVIYNSPSNANSFGGNYVTLRNNTDASISATLTATKTYNYVYLYIAGGQDMDFVLNLEIIDKAQTHISGEGSEITLANTAEALFDKFDIKGDTQQHTYSGKNKLSLIGKTDHGVTATVNDDGTIKITGTATTTDGISVATNGSPNLTAGTYTFTIGEARTSVTNLTIATSDGNKSARIAAGNTSATVTTTAAATTIQLFVAVTNGVTYDETIRLQLVSGSTADYDFEPYVGGEATPNPYYPEDLQVVTGYQTIKITGKNLIPYPYQAGGGAYGITFTNNGDGSITLNGVNNGSGNSSFNLFNNSASPLVLPAGTYYFTPPSSDSIQYVMYDGTSYYNFSSGNNYSYTFATDKAMRHIYVQVQKNNITVFDNLRIYPMLTTQAGLTELDYRPYEIQNIELNLNKNLYDKSQVTTEGGTHQNIAFTTTVNPSTSYVWDVKNRTYATVVLYNSSDVQTRTLGNNATDHRIEFTTAANEVKAKLVFYAKSNVDVTTYDFSGVELYKPEESIYLGKFDTFENRIEKNGDDWYLHQDIKRVILNGTENWSAVTVRSDKYNSSEAGMSDMLNHNPKVYATHFRHVNQDNANAGSHIYTYYGSGGRKFYFPNTIATTKQEWLDWLAANPVTFYYPLATPTDTKITDTWLLDQLQALDEAHAYNEITYIKATPSGTNLPYIMSVDVIKGMGNITITNSGNYIAKPTMTIFGSGDIGIYLNGNQIFQIALGDLQYITIDTAAMEAYKDTLNNLQNRIVTGDYSNFALNTGANTISFSGSVEKFEISKYSRWL